MKRSPVFLVLLLGLTLVVGCSQTSKSETVNQQAAAVSGQENSTANDAVDIVSYQGNWKLKVSEDEELYRMTALMEYCGSTGINIKEIHNGEVKGTIFSMQGAPSYRQAEVAFTGKIEGGKLKASYKDDAWMYSGSIELAFSNGQIEAVITRDKSNDTPMWGIPEGKFTFVRPIETERVKLSDQDKKALEKFLLPRRGNKKSSNL